MTNEELKKKIVDIVAMAILEADELPFVETAEYVADALIAAGIGDLKEHRIFAGKDGSIKQLYSGEEVERIAKERDEYKHRAEVTERALRKAVSVLDAEYRAFGVNRENKTEQRIKNFIEQAEKELAEEGKDD